MKYLKKFEQNIDITLNDLLSNDKYYDEFVDEYLNNISDDYYLDGIYDSYFSKSKKEVIREINASDDLSKCLVLIFKKYDILLCDEYVKIISETKRLLQDLDIISNKIETLFDGSTVYIKEFSLNEFYIVISSEISDVKDKIVKYRNEVCEMVESKLKNSNNLNHGKFINLVESITRTDYGMRILAKPMTETDLTRSYNTTGFGILREFILYNICSDINHLRSKYQLSRGDELKSFFNQEVVNNIKEKVKNKEVIWIDIYFDPILP